jgi:GDPmannose 4,6-dehydratase
VDRLISDPSKAYKKLGWQPQVAFHKLVEMMVQEDLEQSSKKP